MMLYNAVIYAILVACALPLVASLTAKIGSDFGLKQNQNPRFHLALLEGWQARALAASANGFEGLPLFLCAVVVAMLMVVTPQVISILAWAYIVLRVLYTIIYILGFGTIRSIVWFLSTLCPVLLLLHCLQ